MDNETYEDFKIWLETSSQSKWKSIAYSSFDPINSIIYCNCVHCPHKVPMTKGVRWNIGNFKRHFARETLKCPTLMAKEVILSSIHADDSTILSSSTLFQPVTTTLEINSVSLITINYYFLC